MDVLIKLIGILSLVISTSWLSIKMNNQIHGRRQGMTPREVRNNSLRAAAALIFGVYLILSNSPL